MPQGMTPFFGSVRKYDCRVVEHPFGAAFYWFSLKTRLRGYSLSYIVSVMLTVGSICKRQHINCFAYVFRSFAKAQDDRDCMVTTKFSD